MASTWGNQARYGEFEIVGAREGKSRPLGEGSFGKTYEAVRTENVAGGVITEHVAIKVLNPGILGSETKRFQFIQELMALTKFKHSNLIHYIRCGEEGGEVYYAMELCRGRDLVHLVRRFGRIPERVAALIGLQVAAGLHEMHHRHRLVHRDIKPSNIMLVDELAADLGRQHLALRFQDQDSLCRIVDFGLVDFALDARETHQRFVGSAMFASPEQICEQPVDGRSDIYSLGMTLWFLVQGQGPLLDANGEELKDPREAMRRHTLPGEYDAELPSDLSAGFRQLLLRMIAKRPERRFKAPELQEALRHFLNTVVEPEENKFTVTRLPRALDTAYEFQGSSPSRAGRKLYLATQKDNGQSVRLTVVADLQATDPSVDLEALARALCEFGEISRQPTMPEALLPVREVIWATDVLAYAEDAPRQTTLAEVLRVRARLRKPMPFAEAVSILRPIAEALDFLLQHRRETVFLPADEVWLDGAQLAAAPQDSAILAKPLTEWEGLRVSFSMVCLPAPEEFGTWAQQTVGGSMQMSDSDLHPVPAFARLVYRILNGAEVAAAAQFTPHAYVPAVTLGAASNNLLRDLICQQKAWSKAGLVLKELCANEGVTLSKPRMGSTVPETGSTPGSNWARKSKDRGVAGEGEKVCEVVRPGVAISPFDTARREQEIPAAQWVPSGSVRCQFTQKIFRLPQRLDLLVARVIAPGLVQSPYDSPETTQPVPLEDWAPGGQVVCQVSGKRFVLPLDLPLPEGIAPAKGGGVISPYDGTTSVRVPPDLWEPGAEVMCPVAQKNFVLPKDLPPLLALADPAQPGILATPYDPAATWSVEPVDWVAGRLVQCPVSEKSLELPLEVKRWAAQATLVDPSRRLITNPYRPGIHVEVPWSSWKAGGLTLCPETRRSIILPEDLPPLVGKLVSDRPGCVRSPCTGQLVPVPPNEWIPGGQVRCPATQVLFLLPSELPEWIPEGQCSGLPLGRVRSPYEPFPEMPVPPEQWSPNQKIQCPATERFFRLPNDLPPLEAIVKPGKPGTAGSPFSSDWQDVPPEKWKPGQRLDCPATKRPFVLPAALEEWLPDGQWVPLSPGRVRSPFAPHPEIDLTPAQWRPRQVLVCPATRRRFRAPIHSAFPSFEFEQDAVQRALAEPQVSEAEASRALKARHPGATPEQVQSVWVRHGLGTTRERQGAEQIGKVILERPGIVRSPYGSRPAVEVPPAQWAEPNAVLRCPETGRPFRLPGNLPPLRPKMVPDEPATIAGDKPYKPMLLAVLVPGEPGRIISPYAPDESFKITPDDWQPGRQVRCQRTGNALQMPASLPDWTPEATLQEDKLATVRSPFGHHLPMSIPGPQWLGGARISCQETGRSFLLPATLPPLTATAVENRPGWVLTPYAPGREVPVPHRLWTPGAPAPCKATGRNFLLPSALPAWKKRSFPWKIAAAAAAVVAVAGVGVGVWPSKPKRPTDPVIVPPFNTTPNPVIPNFISADFTVEGWPNGRSPIIQLIYNNTPRPNPKIERLGDQKFKVTANLPPEAQTHDSVELKLPGWTPIKKEIEKRDGKFVLPGPLSLHRQEITRSIVKRGGKTDYDHLTVKWIRPLDGEEEVPAPTNYPREISLIGNTKTTPLPLPTGVYEFALEGPRDSTRIKRTVWQQEKGKPETEFSAEVRQTPIELPESLQGEYFGLFLTLKNGGVFFLLTIGEKLESMELQEIALPLADEFSAADHKQVPGNVWKMTEMKEIVLESPTVLKFACPVWDVETNLEFNVNKSEHLLYIMPNYPKDESAKKAMWSRVSGVLDRQAKNAQVEGNEDLKYSRDHWNSLVAWDFTKKGMARYANIDSFEKYRKRVGDLQEALDGIKSGWKNKGLRQRQDVDLAMWPTKIAPKLYRVDPLGQKPKSGDVDWKLSHEPPGN